MKEFKGYKKGVNLGGWLSQCSYEKAHLDSFIAEKDIAKIASWGADHVRLPVDYNILENEDGTFRESGFAYIDNAVKWCEANGLNMVIDLHKAAGYSFDADECESGFFDNEELQERFYRLWEEIARHYGKYSDRSPQIAFELLNEVTDKSFCDSWNRIIGLCIGRIRKIAPDTVILVGGYWNNSPEAVKDLEKPYDDKVVYNVHCYDPLQFTHQHAAWVESMADVSKDMTFAESGVSAEYFLKRFREAAEIAEKNGTVLYCGEYGVIDRATPEDTLSWYKAINAAFEKMGISRAAWSYKKMDFGLSDERMQGVIDELVKYL
jgi:aryl-phospho-beta-D-glucosidase BglC (GH1 family)